MKPGTIVRLPDGREGTVVYHGFDGYGIMWGRIPVDTARILSTAPWGAQPAAWPWDAEAMLREPYLGASLPCVGGGYDIICPVDRVHDGAQ